MQLVALLGLQFGLCGAIFLLPAVRNTPSNPFKPGNISTDLAHAYFQLTLRQAHSSKTDTFLL